MSLENKKTVKVWDIFVRLFHWSLVVAFVVAYLTGEDESQWHIYFGYVIGGLLVFRLVWGVVGSQYARFSDFVYAPSTVVAYVKSLALTSPRHYLGHNPAGGYMVLALLFMLVVTTMSGLKVYGVEGRGPLAGDVEIALISQAIADDDKHEDGHDNEAEEEFWEEVHELSANLTVFLIFLHIAGVFISSRLEGENLVKAMITGRKSSHD